SRMGELLDLAVERDIIHKSGAWFSYGEDRLGQGRDNIKQLLEDNTALAEEIEQKVLQAIAEEREANLKKKSPEKNERVIEDAIADEIKPAVDTKDIDIMVED
ncbi:MAG: DNA recombination/repair protein RecA, partial [Clostridia bacterium]|nr:DNA recombination/repair protein RecA [Clostridia bacterium]